MPSNTDKPVILDRQSFLDFAMNNALCWGSSTAQSLGYYDFMVNSYNAFIASHANLTSEEYDALPFTCEEIKPYYK